jgi:perosamine synthetase
MGEYFDKPLLGGREFELVRKALEEGGLSQGRFVKEFQESVANYCGVDYGLAVSNGTCAIHLALMALGIKEGDEVIVPSYSFIASANPVSYLKAKPVFADVTPDTFCMDPDQLKKLITPKTKAIMPVHILGHPCDMSPIMEVAKDNGLYVVEDAAEALGAEYKGKKVGSFGDISCFSFYSNKLITTGEGGACLTNNSELKEKMALLRAQGKELISVLKEKGLPQFYHQVLGYNYRMTELQGALGIAQMERLNSIIDAKRRVASMYNEALTGVDVSPAVERDDSKHVYWQYQVLFRDHQEKLRAMQRLSANQIECRESFFPLHMQPIYNFQGELPVSKKVYENGLILPNSVNLSMEKINSIVNAIKQ